MENISNTTLNSPVASQDDVNKMYNKIQQLSEPDQLSVMRREVKFKKIMFSNLPSNFSLFRQYKITAKVMYQNLLQLYLVNDSNQTVSVEDIYEITKSLASLSKNKLKN